jgi:lipoprotein-anchoring transpeptidase ErfK/SrfK
MNLSTETTRGLAMKSRFLAAIVATAGLLAMTANVLAASNNLMDPEERFSGGNPIGRLFGFSSSPVSRETVNFANTSYRPGTIVISTKERRLYLVQDGGRALRYGIGVGRPGFAWSGVKTITAKKEWPSWTPPSQMLKRRPDLPRFMPGGESNPLGARAMYLGSTLYRIHGSNEPETIGQAVSSGCFRMTNEDVADLYNRVAVGTTVVVKHD